MNSIITIFLGLLGFYFAIGFVFGLYFVFKGAPKIDPLMQDTKKKVRVLLFPGVIAIWPFLIRRLRTSKTAEL